VKDDTTARVAVAVGLLEKNAQDTKRRATWSEKKPDGRWRPYALDEILQRDKCSLDLFWLKDESLEANDNLPEPGVIAAEIVEDLKAALEQFAEIEGELGQ